MLNSWLVVNWRSFEAQNRTNSVSLLASSKQTDRPPFPCHWIHSDKEMWPKHEAIQSDLKHSAASLYMAVSRQVFGRNAGNCVQTMESTELWRWISAYSSPLPKTDRKSTHHIFHPKSEPVLTQSRQNPIERSANLRASLRLASFIYGKALPPE